MKIAMIRRFFVAALIVTCLMTLLFTVAPIKSAVPGPGEYDVWLDWNDDGKIDMKDIGRLAKAFGTSGQNVSKAALAYDSGWLDLRNETGENYTITHNLSFSELQVDACSQTILGWNKTYGRGGIVEEHARALVQTRDGGYALAGDSYPGIMGYHDFLLVKTDADGKMQWNRTYGGIGNDDPYALVQTDDGGYALAGWTNSFGAGSWDCWLVKTDASGTMQWNETYGGTDLDVLQALVQTTDGGYAMVGNTRSLSTNSYDCWLMKTDASGTMQWSETYGGTDDDCVYALVQTLDGGYTLAGYTASLGAGGADSWLIKTDDSGTIQWNKTYGGTYGDWTNALVQTDDGGYALAGETRSFGNTSDSWLVKTDVTGNMEWNRTYGGIGSRARSLVQTKDGGYATVNGLANLLKTDGLGNIQWNQTYGGTGNDEASALVQTAEGGYALAGYCTGVDATDFWLIKTDASGNVGVVESGLAWKYTSEDTITLYREATDVTWNYVRVRLWQPRTTQAFVAAPSGSPPAPGEYDAWLDWNDDRKIDMKDIGRLAKAFATSGQNITKASLAYDSGRLDLRNETGENYTITHNLNNMELQVDVRQYSGGWNRTYGGTGDDFATAFVQTADGGYALAGYTNSSGAGKNDFWLIKTDDSGNTQWNTTYGGTDDESASALVQTTDGGYALAGYTTSFGTGNTDFWLVKTDTAGNMEWNKTYGGTANDWADAMLQTVDGGYILAGDTASFGAGNYDFWLVKTDPDGNIEWNQTCGGYNFDEACSVVQTSDGGFALAGTTASFGAGNYDFWLVKTDPEGNIEWNQTYGEYHPNMAYDLVQTGDGGFALAGDTVSLGHGNGDVWLIKTDTFGNMQWNKTYGGTDIDTVAALVETGDDGIAMVGSTTSLVTDDEDVWLIKTDTFGNMQWNKTYGGMSDDIARAVDLARTIEGGYVLAYATKYLGVGGWDSWFLKTDVDSGLSSFAWTYSSVNTITLSREATDTNWNYVRVRIWKPRQTS